MNNLDSLMLKRYYAKNGQLNI